MVFITGNVPCSLIGRDSFQEVDITGITMPIVKHNYIVKDVTKLADTIRKAFEIAKSGRPGPVLIDIPKDIQTADCDFVPGELSRALKKNRYTSEDIREAVKMMTEAEKPYIYCGGGVVNGDAEKELLELANRLDCPVGTSMMGLSGIPASDKHKSVWSVCTEFIPRRLPNLERISLLQFRREIQRQGYRKQERIFKKCQNHSYQIPTRRRLIKT